MLLDFFGICSPMHCPRRMRTNMNLTPEEDQMLLNFLWNSCSDALFSTHENEYDLGVTHIRAILANRTHTVNLKNTSHHLSPSAGCHLLGVHFITILRSNISHSTQVVVLTRTHNTQLHSSANRICNCDTPVTDRKSPNGLTSPCVAKAKVTILVGRQQYLNLEGKHKNKSELQGHSKCNN